jgi:choline dehydrogenase-like flavoprotein
MTALNGYLNEAIEKGVEVLVRCSAKELILKNGAVSEIRIRRPGGKEFSLKADIFILSGGSLGTPKLLLSSTGQGPGGVANSSGQVGKNLMVHPLGLAEGFFDRIPDVAWGPKGSWMYSLEFGAFLSKSEPGFMLQMLRGDDLVNLGRKAVRLGKLSPQVLPLDAIDGSQSSVGMAVVVEDLPSASNSVSLDYSTKDAFELPGIKVNYKVNQPSKNALGRGLSASRRVLLEMGAHKTTGIGPVRGAGWHPSGTARMGEDPKTSVTNEYGRSHDISNLFIADASLFPTGSCLNPTNTIQALSLFVADGILNGR